MVETKTLIKDWNTDAKTITLPNGETVEGFVGFDKRFFIKVNVQRKYVKYYEIRVDKNGEFLLVPFSRSELITGANGKP